MLVCSMVGKGECVSICVCTVGMQSCAVIHLNWLCEQAVMFIRADLQCRAATNNDFNSQVICHFSTRAICFSVSVRKVGLCK